MTSKIQRDNLKFIMEMIKSEKWPSSAAFCGEDSYITYRCGCRFVAHFQPDTANKTIRIVGPFYCETCPDGLPEKLTIHKKDRKYCVAEKIMYKGPGIAINISYKQFENYFQL